MWKFSSEEVPAPADKQKDPNNPIYGAYPQQPGYIQHGHPSQPYPSQSAFPLQASSPPPPGFIPQSELPPQFPTPSQGFLLRETAVMGPKLSENYDPEDQSVKGFDFSDQSIRRGFIRKVYSILTVQLGITLGLIALFMYHRGTKLWVQEHPEMFRVAFIVMIVTVLMMSCCEGVRRKAPMNFIFLALFTLAQAFLLGMITARYSSDKVLVAVGITAAICLGLTLFAFQTKWDFTMLGGVLFVALIILLLFGIVAMFFPGKIITMAYASAGAVLFSIYLIHDTQMMMGGEHKYSISPEEYIFAALNLYLDIVNLFLYILAFLRD